MSHRKKYFTYRSIDDLRRDIEAQGVVIGLEDALEAVRTPARIGSRSVGNRLGIHPMEGCDATRDGAPDELTFRRWRRFGEGGAKLLWGEATAVVPEGRANARQLVINARTQPLLGRLLEETRAAHRARCGSDDDLIVGLQLTHSGRWSYPRPILAAHLSAIDRRTFIDRSAGLRADESTPLLSDDDLLRLQDAYIAAARLAADAGFDFVDIKQCHTYLLGELLCARRRAGRFGGSFENRTRFVREVLDGIRAETGPRLILASRINAFDGVPYTADPDTGIGRPDAFTIPYEDGFGVDPADPLKEDLTEPVALARMLAAHGVDLLNVSLGSPYYNPHVGRPYERASEGSYETPEHPLAGVDRHFRITAALQEAVPDVAVVGTGYSWLQKYLVHAAEWNIRRGRVTIAAVGRGALAYPEFATDALTTGELQSKRVCLTVSFCTDLMRAKKNALGQFPTGCVPRDEVYADVYREVLKGEG
ncbi:MAG: NADH:flavin oxidoreductase [Ignavibacteria bacterium]|nr:NADH:flavin oxidoreductase [Ignavibacteria bacterium]